MSAHPCTDSRPHHHRRRKWLPRGSENPNPNEDPSPSVPPLVQELEEKLSRGAVECMICCEAVRRSSPIWSCSSCFSIFHLRCVRRWSRSPASLAGPSSSSNWRCPGCQSVQSVQSDDLSYTCFCGRHADPANDLFLTAHSCGEPCRKPLDRSSYIQSSHFKSSSCGDVVDDLRCPHVCVLPCHPGPCPPCKAFAPRRPCPCGKTPGIVRRCADRASPITCGSRCDRLLSCSRHRCGSECHSGPCPPCDVLATASCFCGKRTEAVLCRDTAFSCGRPCGRSLFCGNHECREPCHPGPCRECALAPGVIRTCYCGKTKLEKERKSCLDAIPTCSGTCEKTLLCGVHRCKDSCHEGACSRCSVRVDQRCRCGSSQRTVECYMSTEGTDTFVCDKPCGQKKNCGRHRCSERCCPLSKPGSRSPVDMDRVDQHLCLVPCGKRLRCGQHTCQLLCHSGHCPPCLETTFSDLSCTCGKTWIPPPIPCGTPLPSCTHPCLVPQPCGHSASHTCHSGDCPPCSVPVSKECIGEHVLLRNIPCGSKDIRCNQLCGKTRQCGIHACTRTCHPPPCFMSDSLVKSSCGQVCGAPRRDCKHTCTASCHPSALCPDTKCEFPVTITCSCGRITATVPCGAGSMLEERRLACDEECEKQARKRQLAEAFDISKPNLDPSAPDLLSDLFRRDPKWVLAVEERFKFLVLGKAKGATTTRLKLHIFCPMLKDKRDAIQQLAERWKLSVQAAGWEPKKFLVVHVMPKSKPPSRILGAPIHPPVLDPHIDMDPRLVVAMLDLPRDADINALVLRFGGECELVWPNDKNALAVFSDPARAATALRRLNHGSAYQGAVVVAPNGVKEEAGSGTVKHGNPWKKSELWGRNVVPVWRRNETPPLIGESANRWSVLDRDASGQALAYGSAAMGHDAVDSGGGGPVDDQAAVKEVDDWEEAWE